MKARGGFSQPARSTRARAREDRTPAWATLEEHLVGAIVLAARLFGWMRGGSSVRQTSKSKSANEVYQPTNPPTIKRQKRQD